MEIIGFVSVWPKQVGQDLDYNNFYKTRILDQDDHNVLFENAPLVGKMRCEKIVKQ